MTGAPGHLPASRPTTPGLVGQGNARDRPEQVGAESPPRPLDAAQSIPLELPGEERLRRSPYKRLVKAVEDLVSKRAQAADTAANTKVDSIATDVATPGEVGAATAANGGQPPEPVAKKIDLGTVAAIGVAIGGVGTLFGALLGTMFGLGKWLPLGLFGLMMPSAVPRCCSRGSSCAAATWGPSSTPTAGPSTAARASTSRSAPR